MSVQINQQSLIPITVSKITHSSICMIYASGGCHKKVLVDPGIYMRRRVGNSNWSVHDLDAIFITHAHRDHIDTDYLAEIMRFNPHCKVYVNSAVATVIDSSNACNSFNYTVLQDHQVMYIGSMPVESFTTEHEPVLNNIKKVSNTALLFDNRILCPGDAFFIPPTKGMKQKDLVDVLAVPIAGPWLTLQQAMTYVVNIHPKIAFGVHDAMIDEETRQVFNKMAKVYLADYGIRWAESLIEV